MNALFTYLPRIRSSNTHYKVCKNSRQQSTSETEQDKMDKQFDNLTWSNLTIIDYELKALWEFDAKSLKYKDLWVFCSQLKVKGVKSSTKEQMIKRLVLLHQIRAKYDKILETPDPVPTRKEPQCPYRLLNIIFLGAFFEGFAQLGNVAARTELDVVKAANNQYFGKVSKKPSKDMMKSTTICILEMMRF